MKKNHNINLKAFFKSKGAFEMKNNLFDILLANINEQLETARLNNIAAETASRTSAYNAQFKDGFLRLTQKREKYDRLLKDELAKNPKSTAYRNNGVQLAWCYELLDIQMGGKGCSRIWTDQEKEDLRKNGSVKGIQGHHNNSVSAYPEEQANPDNIVFLTAEEHLKAHDGNFRNPTHSNKLQDKNRILQKINQSRVNKNEACGFLKGVGLDTICAGLSEFLEQSRVEVDSDKTVDFKTKTKKSLKIAAVKGGALALKYIAHRVS